MSDVQYKAELEKAKKETKSRLNSVRGKTGTAYDLELGKERHFESRFRRVVDEQKVAVNVYFPKEVIDALDEECGPIIPGKKRICRQFSRAYMVELFIYQRLINPRARFLPGDARAKRYGSRS